MTHTRSPKKAVITPSHVEITKILNGIFIAKGFMDHSSKGYNFSHFMPLYNPSALHTHANEVRNIWHERFSHLNYKYIPNFCDKYMVIGFPKIKFSKGVY